MKKQNELTAINCTVCYREERGRETDTERQDVYFFLRFFFFPPPLDFVVAGVAVDAAPLEPEADAPAPPPTDPRAPDPGAPVPAAGAAEPLVVLVRAAAVTGLALSLAPPGLAPAAPAVLALMASMAFRT